MKIGIVSSYFYPWYGGITEHVYYQYKELKQRGHQVKLITPFDGGDVLKERDDLIKIGRPVPLILNGSVVKIPILMNRKAVVNNILSRERFDILHLHQPLFCVLGLSFLNCLRELKSHGCSIPRVVGTFHACGGGVERFIVKRLAFLSKKYRGQFDFRIAVSAASRDFISPFLPGEYAIIPNGVDVQRFSRSSEKIASFDDGVLNILFVGRLEPRKGLTRLLKSIPYVKKYTNKEFRLLVVGNGLMTSYYKSRVPREASDKVVFTGGVSTEDLPRYYNTAHLFCSPASYGESFGIVLVEAMAAGLPIVAGNNEGYRKVIKQDKNGHLVNSEEPESIASHIGMLLESEQKRGEISIRNRLEARKYSWAKIYDKIEQVYLSFDSGN